MARSESISKSCYLQALLASTALISVNVAQGQDNAATGDDTIEEIVVRGTARKFRPDDQTSATGLRMALIDTPQAVSVITPEMMDTIGADSAYMATDLVPNVQRSGYGFGLSQVVMRGIFNTSRRVNSILLGDNRASPRSYATERIEVVRGPATAIYGVTGSFGGEINAILKKPMGTNRLQVGAEVGSYDTRKIYMDATGPFTSDGNVSGRLVAKYDEYDLPLDIPGESFPNYEGMVLGALTWDISDQSSVTFSYYHQQRNTDPWDGGALIQDANGNLSLPTVDPEQWYFSHPDQSRETATTDFALVELDYEFNNGWVAQSKLAMHQYDEDLEYFYPFGPFGAYSLADDEIYIYTYDIERSGEELTFNQSLGGDFEWLGREHQIFAALEYNEDTDPGRFELLNSFFWGYARIDWFAPGVYDGQQPLFADGSPFLPTQGDRETDFGVRQEQLNESKNLRLSLQTLFDVTDRMQVLLGILYQDSESITTIPRNRGVDITPPEVTNISFKETVYRIGLTYDIVDDWGVVNDARIYYSFSEGFEPQTITDGDGVTTSAPQEMEQHEIGVKAEMLDSAVGLSAALFQYEITNIPVSSSFLGSFGGFGSTVLEGTQEATGLELEVIGEILPGWNVLANYTWMDAEIQNPNNTASTPPRTTPENSGNITTTYEFLDGGLAGLRVGASLKFSGNYGFIEGTSNVNRFGPPPNDGAHQRFDLNASYAPTSGRFQNFDLYFNWRNVFDEKIVVAKQGNPGFGIMFLDQPTVNIGLRYTTN